MMVWIDGALNPNEIKDKALGNGGDIDFQKRLIDFLDDTISTAVPADPKPDLQTPLSKFHPCATRGPGPNIPPNEQDDADQKDLHNLAERCQRHRHTATCYKYWKGYPQPKECRFDLDKDNETLHSVFDQETGEIELRTLDGLVNNFNETMLRAIRCNMDIKFIGSGPAAKAILYYITDYITKSQLQAHVAYAALELSVQKLGDFNPEEDDLTSRSKRLLQRCAHSLISKQELSAQQVASYLMDYEDHFTSDRFTNLYWTSLEAFINSEDPSPECYKQQTELDVVPEGAPQIPEGLETSSGEDEHLDDVEETAAVPDTDNFVTDSNDLVSIALDASGQIKPTANQACDYQKRGDVLEDVNVWDFIAQTEKEKIKKGQHDDDEDEEGAQEKVVFDADVDPDTEWNRHNILDFEGRPLPRVPFKNDHLEDDTHVIKVRSFANRKVPVPIGPSIPRRDKADTVQKHARLMLILFKPWRHADDLRHNNQSWLEAYQQFVHTCSPEILECINNMQLLHECKDSRDAHFANRRIRRRAGITLELQRGSRDSNDFGEETDETLMDHLDAIERSRSIRADGSRADVLTALECATRCQLIGGRTAPTAPVATVPSTHTFVSERHPELEALWVKTYEARKQEWRQSTLTTVEGAQGITKPSPESSDGGIRNGAAFRDFVSGPSQAQIREADQLLDREPAAQPTMKVPSDIPSLIKTHQLNAEQARAFSIVAEHSMLGAPKNPLRMHLGGAGGTGKSRVINALQDFFIERGQSRRFRLSSYTGVAARNISGMTLHAALMLGDHYGSAMSSKSKRDLMAMWEGVDYLFVDEISMVGCAFLYEISHALSVAKGNDLAFGGINVVFAGDFAQLPPVGQKRLYAHLGPQAATTNGQKVVFGKLLWLSVNTVVMLHENMRQSGPENQRFVELLSRMREGRCTAADYELLNTRLASKLNIDWTSDKWKRAPVIVAENAMKDALNVKMAQDFAISTGQPLHWYYAQDTHSKNKPVENNVLQDKLMQMDSAKTLSRLGRLPLVIGMPVMIAQNFDVPGGVVNGCTGTLAGVRYQVGADGRRYAISCIIDAPDTTPGIMPELPPQHVAIMQDTVKIKFRHPHSNSTISIKRTQLPVLPAFSITAHKAQGKTLPACIVNFTGCKGSEAPYVMVSRATSLEGLVILTPFPKDKICCRQNEDVRLEFRRLKYHALRTIVGQGTAAEVARASRDIAALYNPNSGGAEVEGNAGDACDRVIRLQRANAVLTAPINRARLSLSTPIPATQAADGSISHARRPLKRRLDDPTPSGSPKRPKHALAPGASP
jgi:hypothetical protein